jgi:hypothetical protein
MVIRTNEHLIKKNKKIAQITTIIGLIVLVVGMVVAFRWPEKIYITFSTLIFGLLFSQIGIFYTNRWGRTPRPDELLNQALKGLDSKYHLYHYLSPTAHLLVGPAGIWVLAPRHQRGTISYSKGRWRQKGGNLYLKIFAQEGIGRPDLDLAYDVEKIQNFLLKQLPDEKIPPIQAALIFTNEKTVIQIDENENPIAATLYLDKLKDFFRKEAKGKPIPFDKIGLIQNTFIPPGIGLE